MQAADTTQPRLLPADEKERKEDEIYEPEDPESQKVNDMLNHFTSLMPVDMLFQTTDKGEIIPVRFRIRGKNENAVCRITGYRLIKPDGDYTTSDGVFLNKSVMYYDALCSTEYERNQRLKIYYDKDGTCWYISRKPQSKSLT